MVKNIKTRILTVSIASLVAIAFTGCGQQTPPVEEPADSKAVVSETKPAPKPAPVQKREEAPAPRATSGGKSVHVVEKGDNLWNISKESDVYADPFQWPIIYKANRDQIKDPDLIYPNQKFEIPRNASSGEIADAVHEAKTRGPWSLWDGK